MIGTDITFTSKLTVDSLEAPVSAGVECGFLTVKYGDDELAVIPLVTKSDVEGSRLLKQMEEIREFSQSRVFIATVVSAVVITLLYYADTCVHSRVKAKKARQILSLTHTVRHKAQAFAAKPRCSDVILKYAPKTIDTSHIWSYNKRCCNAQ